MSATTRHCRNCEARLLGSYCHVCGQADFVDAHRRLPHLLRQFVGALSDLDGRLWRSLRWLMLRPGALSREFLQGRRKRWLAPMTLFLALNLVYFLFSPLSDFNLSLGEQMQAQPWSPLIRPVIESRLSERSISFADYAERYAEVGADIAETLIVWHVPWLALGWMLLFADRGLYYAEHFVVATHAVSFILLFMLLISGLMSLLVWFGLGPLVRMVPLALPALAAILFCLLSEARQAYRVSWLRALLSLPLMLVVLVLVHWSYRALQFAVILVVT